MTELKRDPEYVPIAVRGIAVPVKPRPEFPPAGGPEVSEWAIFFDTETDTVDHGAAQPVLVIPYQIYQGNMLRFKGFAFDPVALYPQELETLITYSRDSALNDPIDIDDFRSRFYRFAYDFRAHVVGFNLLFDFSRIAHDHGSANRSFYGGFSFRIAKDPRYPPVRAKKLNARAYRFDFAAPRRPKAKHNDEPKEPTWRGSFVDLKAAGDALLGGRYDLGRLAGALDVPVSKMERPGFTRPIDRHFLEYAYRDVEVTAACYFKLSEQFNALGLPKTLDKIYSEASVAKAEYLRMGIRPWLKVQGFQWDFLQYLLD